MTSPQAGIFALGTSSHTYLEFELAAGAEERALLVSLASLREPRTTVGGVNLVVGVRPELWRDVAAADRVPRDVRGFEDDVVGPDGFSMPGTQHDAVLWLSGTAYDVVFDTARGAVDALEGLAVVHEETASWPYRHDRDLTGFEDGTENPSLIDAPSIATVPLGDVGAGGSVMLLQKWVHDTRTWEALSTPQQERVMGRRRADSVELEDRPGDSHVSRTDQETFGHIFRRNMPYGTVTDHGTMFVGFCARQEPLQAMLEAMAGLDGPRDALTRFATPLTGGYYWVPPVDALAELARPDAHGDDRERHRSSPRSGSAWRERGDR